MGSHSARHRPARQRVDRPEERATALLARLGAAAPTGAAPTRHAARPAAGALDPFPTAPHPTRPPRPTSASGSGASRYSGTRTILHAGPAATVNPLGVPLALPIPRPAADDLIGEGPGTAGPQALGDTASWFLPADVAEVPADLTAPTADDAGPAAPAGPVLLAGDDAALSRSAPTDVDVLPEDDAGTPVNLAEPARDAAVAENGWDEPPAGLSPGDLPPVPGHSPARRLQPVIAALSVTAVGASAVLTAVLPDTAPATPQADGATTRGAAPVGTLSFALPAADPGPPEAVAGPASVLASGQPVQVSSIVAKAVADAQAIAAKQAEQKAADAKWAAEQAAAAAAAKARTAIPAPRPAHAPGGAGGTAVGPVSGSGIAARALAAARTRLGLPYVWGAAGPTSFDCSGLVMWAFRQVGVSLPHSSAAQSTMGAPVSKANLQPGDLVFFYSPVSHVGIYLGNGQVLHASESGEPVKVTNMAYMPFHNARRITG